MAASFWPFGCEGRKRALLKDEGGAAARLRVLTNWLEPVATPGSARRRVGRLAGPMSGLTGAPTIQNTDGIIREGRVLLDVVKGRGMEGIVAKRLGSRYAPGQRRARGSR